MSLFLHIGGTGPLPADCIIETEASHTLGNATQTTSAIIVASEMGPNLPQLPISAGDIGLTVGSLEEPPVNNVHTLYRSSKSHSKESSKPVGYANCFGLPYQDHNYGAPPPPTPPQSPKPNDPTLDDDTSFSIISTTSTTNEEELPHQGESITRCICGFNHDDEYMICCDKCLAWQHVDCMGLDRNNMPDVYMCERCAPRKVDKQKAKSLQTRKREKMTAESSSDDTAEDDRLKLGGHHRGGRRGIRTKKNHTEKIGHHENIRSTKKFRSLKQKDKDMKKGKPRRRTKSRSDASNTVDEEAQDAWVYSFSESGDKYEEASCNQYTPEVQLLLASLKINGQHDEHVKKISEILDVRLCRMGPVPGGKGLITLQDVGSHQPITEYRGKVLLVSQFRQQNPVFNKRCYPYVLFYKFYPTGEEVCIDAREFGNEARFVRRSCTPNALIRHIVQNGSLRIFLFSCCEIKRNHEVTIPFDFNYKDCISEVDCACIGEDCRIASLHNKISNKEVQLNEPQQRRRRASKKSSLEDDSSQSSITTAPTTPITPTTPLKGVTNVLTTKSETVTKEESSEVVSITATELAQESQDEQHQGVAQNQDEPQERETEKQAAERRKKMTREERKIESYMRAFERMEKMAKRRQTIANHKAQQKRMTENDKSQQQNQPLEGSMKEEDDGTPQSVPNCTSSDTKNEPCLNPGAKLSTIVPNMESAPQAGIKEETKPVVRNKKGKRRRGSGSMARKRNRTSSGGSDMLSPDENPLNLLCNTAAAVAMSQQQNISSGGSVSGSSPGTPVPSHPMNGTTINMIPNSVCGNNVPEPASTPPPVFTSQVTASPECIIPKSKRYLMRGWLQEKADHPLALPVPVSCPLSVRTEGWTPSLAKQPPPCYFRCTKDNQPHGGISASHLRRNSASGGRPPTSLGSAKKRWLRQAMGESTDGNEFNPNSLTHEDMENGHCSPMHNGCLSPGPNCQDVGSPSSISPPGDYVTPLKKRRLMRESLDSVSPGMLSPGCATMERPTSASSSSASPEHQSNVVFIPSSALEDTYNTSIDLPKEHGSPVPEKPELTLDFNNKPALNPCVNIIGDGNYLDSIEVEKLERLIPEKINLVEIPEKINLVEIPEKSNLVEIQEKRNLVEIPEKRNLVEIPEKRNLVEIPEKRNLVEIPEKTNLVEIPEKTNLVEIPEKRNLVEIPEKRNLVEIPEKTNLVEIPAKTNLFKVPAKSNLSEKNYFVEIPEKNYLVEIPVKTDSVRSPALTNSVQAPAAETESVSISAKTESVSITAKTESVSISAVANAVSMPVESNLVPIQSESNSVRTPSESNSVRTPSESNSVRTPSESNSVRTPSESNSVRTPSETNSVRTPLESNSVGTPSETNSVGTPSETNSVRTPLESNSVRTPLESNSVRTPLESNSVRTPSESNSVRTPSESNSVRTPSESNSVRTPSDSNSVRTPSETKSARTPSETNLVSTPSVVNSVVTPSVVNSVVTPSVVNSVVTPSVVNSVVTPSVVNSVVTPSVVNSVVTPSETNSVGTPSETNLVPIQSETNSVGTPSETNSVVTPSETNSVVTPSETNSVVTPSETNLVPIQSETNSVGTPSETNSVGTPSETNSVGTPSETNSVGTPSETNSVGTPSETNSVGTPSETNSVRTPSETNSVRTPSETNSVRTPSETNSVRTPSETNSVRTPSETNSVRTPSESNSVRTPSEINSVRTPSEINSVRTPSEINSVGTPSEINSVGTPSESNSVGTPSETDSVGTPSKLDSVPTPSKIESVPTPSKIESVPTPSKIESVPTPSKIESVPTPSKIESVPTPSEIESVPTPSKIDSVATPSKIDSVATPSKIDSVATPSEIESVATPKSDSVRSSAESDSVRTSAGSDSVRTSAGSDSVRTTVKSNSVPTPAESDSVQIPAKTHLGQIPIKTIIDSISPDTVNQLFIQGETKTEAKFLDNAVSKESLKVEHHFQLLSGCKIESQESLKESVDICDKNIFCENNIEVSGSIITRTNEHQTFLKKPPDLVVEPHLLNNHITANVEREEILSIQERSDLIELLPIASALLEIQTVAETVVVSEDSRYVTAISPGYVHPFASVSSNVELLSEIVYSKTNCQNNEEKIINQDSGNILLDKQVWISNTEVVKSEDVSGKSSENHLSLHYLEPQHLFPAILGSIQKPLSREILPTVETLEVKTETAAPVKEPTSNCNPPAPVGMSPSHTSKATSLVSVAKFCTPASLHMENHTIDILRETDLISPMPKSGPAQVLAIPTVTNDLYVNAIAVSTSSPLILNTSEATSLKTDSTQSNHSPTAMVPSIVGGTTVLSGSTAPKRKVSLSEYRLRMKENVSKSGGDSGNNNNNFSITDNGDSSKMSPVKDKILSSSSFSLPLLFSESTSSMLKRPTSLSLGQSSVHNNIGNIKKMARDVENVKHLFIRSSEKLKKEMRFDEREKSSSSQSASINHKMTNSHKLGKSLPSSKLYVTQGPSLHQNKFHPPPPPPPPPSFGMPIPVLCSSIMVSPTPLHAHTLGTATAPPPPSLTHPHQVIPHHSSMKLAVPPQQVMSLSPSHRINLGSIVNSNQTINTMNPTKISSHSPKLIKLPMVANHFVHLTQPPPPPPPPPPPRQATPTQPSISLATISMKPMNHQAIVAINSAVPPSVGAIVHKLATLPPPPPPPPLEPITTKSVSSLSSNYKESRPHNKT